jgi:hypothetical protein
VHKAGSVNPQGQQLNVAVICTATAMVQALYDENTALQQYLREIGKE